jgi:hypothetical protein
MAQEIIIALDWVSRLVNGEHTLLQISRFEYQRWGFPAQLERNLVNVQQV